MRRDTMKKRFDKLVAMVLALLILVLPGALSARERRGAKLGITLKDGYYVAGELIAVKPDSLLLLNPAQKDESVDHASIRSIRIIRKSKAGLGAACGILAAVVGTVIVSSGQKESDNPLTLLGQGMEVAGAAISFGTIGLGIGIGGGLLAGKDKLMQLEGKSESEVRQALAYLRGKARIRDFK
jgi:hypothetical protein